MLLHLRTYLPNAHHMKDGRSRIPSVSSLIDSPEFRPLMRKFGHSAVVGAVRDRLGDVRDDAILADERISDAMALTAADIASHCELVLGTRFATRPQGVINATGVIVHTNLGRAPLSSAAIRAAESAGGYVDLEYDIESGKRGSRHDLLEDAIRQTTGSESGIAVNNNAAATMLVLAALAGDGREVIVSRSEAVEIGGGFRIPDVLAQSTAKLVEVGTTNRTYAGDYADAITERTAAILKVHRSNFAISGFTHDASVAELAEVGRDNKVPVIHDIGSGALLDTSDYGLEREPMVQESLRDGAGIVMFSGDKLLGGPQAGIIAGNTALIDSVKSHPLARAMRIDKLTVAALHATLMAYVRDAAVQEIPVWQMIAADTVQLRNRAELWREGCGNGSVVEGESTIGGGSAPGQTLPTWLLKVQTALSPDEAASKLRQASQPIIGRIVNDALYLDPRTVLRDSDADAGQPDTTDVAIIDALKQL